MLGVLAAGGEVRADKLVTVRSVVDRAYHLRRTATQPPKIETYVFAQGECFDPIPMDAHLERMEFRTIAATLARDLKTRNYEPAKDLASADLMLVVHWGVTMANENNASQLLYEPDVVRLAVDAAGEAQQRMNDPAVRNDPRGGILEAVIETELEVRRMSAEANTSYSRSERRHYTNAELLGFQTALAKEQGTVFTSANSETLHLMVNEERYFVVVMAFDAAELREGRRKRVWTTRASIRAAGVNFAIALDRISSVAGNYHGELQDSLALAVADDRHKLRTGEVIIGEITVIGESPPAARREKR